MIDAKRLLDFIDDTNNSYDMILPNIHLAVGSKDQKELKLYFEGTSFTCEVEDAAIATAEVAGSVLTVTGVKARNYPTHCEDSRRSIANSHGYGEQESRRPRLDVKSY